MTHPFTAPSPAEVPLPNAPLVQVLSQVRFPIVAAIEHRDFIANFQQAIYSDYPVLRQHKTQNLTINGLNPPEVRESALWQFTDLEQNWKISLASEFIALETNTYRSRTEFLDRLGVLLNALQAHVNPGLVDRLGVRYINQLKGEEITKSIINLVKPEILGLLPPFQDFIHHYISEATFSLPPAMLLARWGQLPPGQTTDPSSLPPVNEISWILDLDMSNQQSRRFNVEKLLEEARGFTEHIYTLFRWMVTDEFLRKFGGNV
jgi:uncharacterized protein (TIGR04255 family)